MMGLMSRSSKLSTLYGALMNFRISPLHMAGLAQSSETFPQEIIKVRGVVSVSRVPGLEEK
eukprot:COSAG01_NODE_10923_length_2049_cov_8.108718_4_plen_61_part_00